MPRRKPLTWDLALDLYETSLLARRSSPLTVKAYRRDLSLLRRLTRPAELNEVSSDLLYGAQAALLTGRASRSGRPYSAATAGRASAAWRGFFGFLAREGKLPTNPAERLKAPKQSQPVPEDVLSKEEVQALLAAPSTKTAAGVRDRALIEVLYATGVRCGELRDLDLEDLDHSERLLTVRAGKGDKGRVIPLARSAYYSVVAYLEESRGRLLSSNYVLVGQAAARAQGWRTCDPRALFVTTRGNRLCEVPILRLLRKHAAKAGINKKVKPHGMRRTFATHLLKGGADLRSIQLLLGHVSLDTTARYLRVDNDELRTLLLLKHPREGFEV